MTLEGKEECMVYIDGFNWYHAIFKNRPDWKWLNIQSFFEGLRHREEIIAVKMFSAWMEHDADAKARQEHYFKALMTLPKVRLIMGAFQVREVTCRADCNRKYTVYDEKKTDVNLAVELIDDALNGRCDSMCVVSGDSDVQPAVEWVVKHCPQIKVTVYVPALPPDRSTRRTDYYKTKRLNVECKFLPLETISVHQLKQSILIAPGQFSVRPHMWQVQPLTGAAE
ncbi:MAG TPA: NYN domain-containing protein [Verrucomicrobiae bacterium]|nr:NYN domain-containing protein [Verrucomicrobiae bacterium]